MNLQSFKECFQHLDTKKQYAFIDIDIKNFETLQLQFPQWEIQHIQKQIEALLQPLLTNDDAYVFLNEYHIQLLIQRNHKEQIQKLLTQIDDAIYFIDHPHLHQQLFLGIGVYFLEEHDDYWICSNHACLARVHSLDIAKLNTHIEYYKPALRTKLIRRHNIERAMRRALAHQEYTMVLQPKIDLSTMQIYGGEALLRWEKQTQYSLSTFELISIAEENGFVRELDIYMFHQVLAFQQDCVLHNRPLICISVNVSRCHFEQADFFDEYLSIFQSYQLPASCIEFEITESAMLHHPQRIRDVVLQMRNAGFSTSLDDFGCGVSSLAALKDIPIHTIKLDRSFFLNESKRSRTIVAAILDMAKQLHITTLAEGIETEEQLHFLKMHGCQNIQGYIFSPPLSISAFHTYMKEINYVKQLFKYDE